MNDTIKASAIGTDCSVVTANAIFYTKVETKATEAEDIRLVLNTIERWSSSTSINHAERSYYHRLLARLGQLESNSSKRKLGK